jgi:UDP-2,3-diacylglucosamine hydrolase
VGSSATNKLALFAGYGSLPITVARNAAAQGYEVHAYGFAGMISAELREATASLFEIPFCKIGGVLERIQSDGISRAVTIGAIAQTRVIGGMPQFDALALELWKRLPDRRVDTIMRLLLDEFEKRGIQTLPLPPFLNGLLAPSGTLTGRAPTAEEWEDIRFGFGLAKYIGGRDIGQTVVVRHRAVMAVEAVEGTDQAIRRGGTLGQSGSVVVKVAKPGQDPRFDIPTVGLETLESMRAAGCSALAVEAGQVLTVDRSELVRRADAAGIAVVGVREEEVDEH